jgi:hypothetical protein
MATKHEAILARMPDKLARILVLDESATVGPIGPRQGGRPAAGNRTVLLSQATANNQGVRLRISILYFHLRPSRYPHSFQWAEASAPPAATSGLSSR